MAAIVAGAAAGAFGGGVLDETTASAGDLRIAFPRFGRAHTPLDVEIEWSADAPETVLWIARDYVDRFTIDEVRPSPAAVVVGPDRIFYTLRTQGAGSRVKARFALRPQGAGAVRGRIGVTDGPDVEIRHWVFP